jgi:hypothetical protein
VVRFATGIALIGQQVQKHPWTVRHAHSPQSFYLNGLALIGLADLLRIAVKVSAPGTRLV